MYPGWEGEVVTFKKQLRIPSQLINVSRPRDAPAPAPAVKLVNKVNSETAVSKSNASAMDRMRKRMDNNRMDNKTDKRKMKNKRKAARATNLKT